MPRFWSLVVGWTRSPIDIAECFAATTVFDVDMANLDIKQQINESLDGPEVRFCMGDLTNVDSLIRTLKTHGWDAGKPTLLVAEGISYYLPKPVFMELLTALRTPSGALVLEYSLPPEENSGRGGGRDIDQVLRSIARLTGNAVCAAAVRSR